MKLREYAERAWSWSKDSETDYWLTRFSIFRLLGFVYFFAFLSLWNQLMPLLGSNGLTPIDSYIPETYSFGTVLEIPTLFWFNQSDVFLQALALTGLIISFLILIGFTNVPMLFVNWIIYLSFVNAGQVWYGYGWEIQLVETGFLAIFLAPLIDPRPFRSRYPPPKPIVWLFRWLAVRIHLGSGLIKLKGGTCWERLTCLDRFFQTQPIPNPVSPWMHYLPSPLHKLGVLIAHIGQLIAPLGAVFENEYVNLRYAAGALMAALQLFLILAGNFSFLNWLTLVPILSFFDDSVWDRILPDRIVERAEQAKENATDVGKWRNAANILFVFFVIVLSVPVVVNLVSTSQAMNASFNNWHFVGSYGAFGSVRDYRTELVMEGTSSENLSNAEWVEYDFPAKPDQVDDPLPVVAPYQPRISWQMWFASMSQPEREPWLLHLSWKLLHNDPQALELVKHNPFQEEPPEHIRIKIYRYVMQPPLEENRWERRNGRVWMQPISRNNSQLERYMERRW